ncbi:hypothetical protein [Candidatus Palauibacter sp.]|uniref:hypothetical protein n=1 Tax=Candidatus Palauibacter sp. TaxID=3101350 RepID=UPI003AF290BC
MTALEEQTPEPGVAGSSDATRKAGWWRHPNAGMAAVLIAWFGLTWTMLRSTKEDIAAVEARLKEDITAVETGLKEDITGVETRLGNHLVRVEGRLDRIVEILLDDARRASAEGQQEEDASR